MSNLSCDATSPAPFTERNGGVSSAIETGRQRFSAELIDSLSLSSFLSWKARNRALGLDHPDHHRSFAEVEKQNGGFLFQLTDGRLHYYTNLVTREGLAAMIALGEVLDKAGPGADRNEILEAHGFHTTTQSGESVHEVLARLDHENWLNTVASREQYRKNGGEWHEIPEAQRAVNREGVLQHCRELALLWEPLQQQLLGLAKEGKGSYFHSERVLSIRTGSRVFASDEGSGFPPSAGAEPFFRWCGEVAKSSDRYYPSHALFNRLEMPHADRELIRRLLFSTEGAPLADQVRSERIAALTQARAHIPEASAELLVDYAEAILDSPTARDPAVICTYMPSRPSFHEAFPNCEYLAGGGLVDYQAGWKAHFLPKYGELSGGFSPRPEDLVRAPLMHHVAHQVTASDRSDSFYDRMAIEILALLQNYPPAALRHLREVGAEMFDQGVLGFGEKKFLSSEGISLRTGGQVKVDAALADSLCFAIRRISLDLSRDPQMNPAVLEREWQSERPRIKRMVSKRPDASWESDYRTVYAVALAVGTLQPRDFEHLLRSASVVDPLAVRLEFTSTPRKALS